MTDKTLHKLSASLVNPQRDAVKEIAQMLFEAEIVLHVLHLQSKNKNGWEHTALGELYEAVPNLVDDIVEKSYAVVGTITQYKSISIQENISSLSYVKSLFTRLEIERNKITTGYIQQMVDNAIEQVAKCIYRLENVK